MTDDAHGVGAPAGVGPRPALAYPLFFLSGAAALAYEATWSRLVGLAIGNTAASAAVVLASYFAGLTAGQLLGGFLARRVLPLFGYGVSELFAAAWSMLVPTLLASAGSSAAAGGDLSPLARAAWCFVVTLPASIALGSTLPFMAAHFADRPGTGRQLTLAYALNTAGGLVGVLGTTAVLFAAVGVRASGHLAAGVSAACGLAACVLAVRPGLNPSETKDRVAASGTNNFRAWWAVAAVSGFGTLALEVLYTRLFALVFHNSSYTFGAVAAVFLAGLAAGAAIVSALGTRVSPRTTVVTSASLGAALVAFSVILFIRLTRLEYFAAGDTFAEYLASAFGLVAGVVLPPVVTLGMAFPAVLAAAGRSSRAVGQLAAVNTAAAMAGALAAGLVLPDWIGLWESVALVALLFGMTGAVVLYARCHTLAAAGAVLLATVATAIAASGQAITPQTTTEEVVRRWNSAYGWIDVVRNAKDNSLTLRQNLHYRHGSTGTSAVRGYRQGRLPLLLHPAPRDVAFLGLGTGLTAAPVVTDRDVSRAVVVELIPEVVEAARLLSTANLGVVDHPKVEVRVDDARHYLAASERRFDAIVSDLFVPWESRTAYLYTSEFYQTVRSRLRAGGLFCQWVALYQLGPDDFELIADSFASVFPNVLLWWGQLDGRFPILALIGSETALSLAPERVAARWEASGANTGGTDPDLQRPSDLPGLFVGRWHSRPGAVLNTDDRPRLEFQAPVSHRSRRTLRGEVARAYFDRLLTSLPDDGVCVGVGWPPEVTDTVRRRAVQRLSLFGP